VGPQDALPDEEHPRHFLAIAEISLSILGEPHEGQATFCDELMTNSSKRFPHFLHSYSNMGIALTSSFRSPRCSLSAEPRRSSSSRTGPRSRTSETFKLIRRDEAEGTS
jgi:hypothetical protein